MPMQYKKQHPLTWTLRNGIESKKTKKMSSLGKELQMEIVMEVKRLKMRILMFRIMKNSPTQTERKSRKVRLLRDWKAFGIVIGKRSRETWIYGRSWMTKQVSIILWL